jgi:dTDP-4-dehydrorhamnose reductase
MKILLLGKRGMMGSMLNFLAAHTGEHAVVALGRESFDALTDPISVLDHHIGADEQCCVVNCIGAIPQRQYTASEFVSLNTTFPIQLADHCRQRGWNLIHLSTNCVFSGQATAGQATAGQATAGQATADQATAGYRIECHRPDAEDHYGQTKAKGEPSYGVVIRSSIIGPENGTAFGLLEWFLNAKSPVYGYVDVMWNGITTLQLSKIILKMIDMNQLESRIVHVFSSRTYSKYSLLNIINEVYEHGAHIMPKEIGANDCTLSSQNMPPCPDIAEQIRELHKITESYRAFHTRTA